MSNDAENFEGFIGLVILLLVGWLIFLMWPVSLWLGLALLVFRTLRVIAARSQPPKLAAGRFWPALRYNAVKDLCDTILWIAIGLGLLALVQLLLTFGAWWANEGTVRWWENHLAAVRDALAGLLSFEIWWKVLLCLVALTIFLPSLKAVSFVANRRKLVSKVLIVLNTMCAFSFFSAAAVESGEARWVLTRRDEARRNLDRIQRARADTVASAWIEHQFRNLPPSGLRDFADFARQDPDPQRDPHFEWRVEQTIATPPIVREDVAGNEDTNTVEALISEINTWTVSDGSFKPTLNDVRMVEDEAQRAETVRDEVQTAVIEIIKGITSDQIHVTDIFVKAFLKTAVGTITKLSIKTVFPKNVTDLTGAREWILVNMQPGAPDKPVQMAFGGIPSEPPRTAPTAQAQSAYERGLREPGDVHTDLNPSVDSDHLFRYFKEHEADFPGFKDLNRGFGEDDIARRPKSDMMPGTEMKRERPADMPHVYRAPVRPIR